MRDAHWENPFHKIHVNCGTRGTHFMEEGDNTFDHAEKDVNILPRYLGPETTLFEQTRTDAVQLDSRREDLPTRNMFYNRYVRVLHTNGLHNLAMVHCLCHGETQLPINLLSNRLVPASFESIKTLFTAQVLDYLRLCNLELKASVYQFYNLLKHITAPMAPN